MGTIDDELAKLPDSNLKPEDIAKYQAENTALLIDKQKEIEDRRAEIERKFEARRNYIFRRTMFGLVAGAFLAIGSVGSNLIIKNPYEQKPEVIRYHELKTELTQLDYQRPTLYGLDSLITGISQKLNVALNNKENSIKQELRTLEINPEVKAERKYRLNQAVLMTLGGLGGIVIIGFSVYYSIRKADEMYADRDNDLGVLAQQS